MDLDKLSYGTFIDGEYMEVEPVDKCMKMLQYRFDGKNRTINNLRNQIKELTDSQYKEKNFKK